MSSKIFLAALAALMATSTIADARTSKPQHRPSGPEQRFDIETFSEQLRLMGS